MAYDPYFAPSKRNLLGVDDAHIKRRATCPKCGRKRVNLYKRNLTWRCSKCRPVKG